MSRLQTQFGSKVYGVVFACSMILPLLAAPAKGDEIIIRSEAVPNSPVVRLGDVAEIRGTDTARIKRLARLPLMPAPAAGTQRFLQAREIVDMLNAHGEDATQMRFVGAAQVAVQPSNAAPPLEITLKAGEWTGVDPLTHAPLDEKATRRAALEQGRVTGIVLPAESSADESIISEPIRQAILDHLAQQTGTSTGWQVDCKLSDRQRLMLAASNSPLTCTGGSAPWIGKQQFAISLTTAAGPLKLLVVADVSLSQPAVVAVRAIPRGAIVTAADVELQQLLKPPAASGRRAPVYTEEELIGMEATRAIQIGDVVFNDHVRKPGLVKRNDAVTVISQGGGIRVRTTARASQDGARGDLVQVESLDSKEKFDARVIGLREVAVLAPARSIDAFAAQTTESELGVFRKYLPAGAAPRDDATREARVFRKYLNNAGEQHAEIR